MDKKYKVLIVDDEIEIGEILGLLLEDRFDCQIFSDANHALEALKKGEFPYIITDLEMPKTSGVQFIRQIRESNEKSLIFISTGHDSAHPRVQEALKAGANGILTKPFMDPDKLINSILDRAS